MTKIVLQPCGKGLPSAHYQVPSEPTRYPPQGIVSAPSMNC
jgi:hypothetical protein